MSETVLTTLPLDRLHESPFNPRKTFTDIDELAEDIKAQGVLQPIVVRPRVPPLFAAGADIDPAATAGHEIVFGHRRFRAAEAAGLTEIPVLVRNMTDEQARQAQISENLARKDVHPFEEAEGFQALMAEHGHSADELVTMFGKSRSYVYGRLKLLQACPEIRKACLAGEIGAETALLIARLRNDKLQGKALGYIRGKGYDLKDGGNRSFRDVQALLKERFTLHLRQAIFPPEDAELVPAAGVCSACPKLSGNAPEFRDLATSRPSRWFRGDTEKGEPDLCTDPDCFADKKKAHLVREATRLRAEGKVVVDGGKAMQAVSATGEVKGAYIALKAVRAELKKVKGAKPATVVIQDPRGGKLFEAVKREDLKAAGVDLEEQTPNERRASGGRARDWEAERREREAIEERENAARLATFHALRARLLTSPRSTDDLRLIARHLIGFDEYSANGDQVLRGIYGVTHLGGLAERLTDMTADELGVLLIDLVLIGCLDANGYDPDDERELLDEAATRYGVDLEAIRAVQTSEPASTPSTAGASAKKKRAAKAAEAAAGAGADLGDEAAAGGLAGDGDGQMDDAGSAGEEAGEGQIRWPFPKGVV